MASVPVSVTAPQFTSDPAPVLEASRVVDSLGFSGIFLFDHLVPIGNPYRPVLEMAAALGAVAVLTGGRVGTLVMRAPLRGPVVSSAIARTAEMLAPGRVVIGLGTGDSLSAEESIRFGRHYGSVAERTGVVGATLDLMDGLSVQRWVGGLHPRILDLAVGRADGWNAWGIDPVRLGGFVSALRARRRDLTLTWGGTLLLGSDPDDLDEVIAGRGGTEGVVAGTPDRIREHLSRCVEAGVDELIVSILPNRRNRWELFAEKVLAAL